MLILEYFHKSILFYGLLEFFDQKPRVKQRIIQTMFGIVGIILAISIVNLIIDLF